MKKRKNKNWTIFITYIYPFFFFSLCWFEWGFIIYALLSSYFFFSAFSFDTYLCLCLVCLFDLIKKQKKIMSDSIRDNKMRSKRWYIDLKCHHRNTDALSSMIITFHIFLFSSQVSNYLPHMVWKKSSLIQKRTDKRGKKTIIDNHK